MPFAFESHSLRGLMPPFVQLKRRRVADSAPYREIKVMPLFVQLKRRRVADSDPYRETKVMPLCVQLKRRRAVDSNPCKETNLIENQLSHPKFLIFILSYFLFTFHQFFSFHLHFFGKVLECRT